MTRDDFMREQLGYLELRLAECTARPELHHYQIEAYRHHLELARAIGRTDRYLALLERTGDLFELSRAEWLDRYYNLARLHHALGDDRRMMAAALNFGPVAGATSHADLAARIAAVHGQAKAIEQDVEFSLIALSRLVIALMEWVTEAPAGRAEKLAEVRARWTMLSQRDPGCSWRRISRHRPYRDRIPFTDGRLATIGSWLAMALGEQAEPSEAAPAPIDPAPYLRRVEAPLPDRAELLAGLATMPPVTASVPSAARAARGYHVTAAALDPRDRYTARSRAAYQRIFEIEAEAGDAVTFARRVAEAGLMVELPRAREIELAEKCLAHSRATLQPHVEHHYTSLIAALERSASPTEVEFELNRHDQLFSVEFAWHDILLHYMTRAIDAVIGYDLGATEPRRQTVVKSYRMVANFFGRDWDQMLRTPRIREHITRVLFPTGRESQARLEARDGAYYGEVGFHRVGVLREAAIAHAIRLAERGQLASPEQMRAYATELVERGLFGSAAEMTSYLSQLFAQAMASESAEVELGPPERHKVVLWGEPIHIDDLLDLQVAPPRPRVVLS